MAQLKVALLRRRFATLTCAMRSRGTSICRSVRPHDVPSTMARLGPRKMFKMDAIHPRFRAGIYFTVVATPEAIFKEMYERNLRPTSVDPLHLMGIVTAGDFSC